MVKPITVGGNGDNNFQIEGWSTTLEAHCSRLKEAIEIAKIYRAKYGKEVIVYQTRQNGKPCYKQVYSC